MKKAYIFPLIMAIILAFLGFGTYSWYLGILCPTLFVLGIIILEKSYESTKFNAVISNKSLILALSTVLTAVISGTFGFLYNLLLGTDCSSGTVMFCGLGDISGITLSALAGFFVGIYNTQSIITHNSIERGWGAILLALILITLVYGALVFAGIQVSTIFIATFPLWVYLTHKYLVEVSPHFNKIGK